MTLTVPTRFSHRIWWRPTVWWWECGHPHVEGSATHVTSSGASRAEFPPTGPAAKIALALVGGHAIGELTQALVRRLDAAYLTFALGCPKYAVEADDHRRKAVQALQDRLATVGLVLADPPQVHPHQTGVWSTDATCYEYMATIVGPGAHTLETGLGVSTVLFALWGCEHTCVVWSEAEVTAFRQHCESRGITTENVSFHIGPSERVLPGLSLRELDLVFIDGCHGFPIPTIDWFYAASMLRIGGVAVLDDAQLQHVRLGLFDFLNKDPRWIRAVRRPKWVAYERQKSGSLGEEWEKQPFLGVPLRHRYKDVVPAAARPFVRTVGRRFRLL